MGRFLRRGGGFLSRGAGFKKPVEVLKEFDPPPVDPLCVSLKIGTDESTISQTPV